MQRPFWKNGNKEEKTPYILYIYDSSRLKADYLSIRYNEEMELEDAVHTAILTVSY